MGGQGERERGIFLGGNSKGFMGEGGEEIADWTLRVSNYFYCPYSPSFLAQSGLLGNSKKCSPLPFLPPRRCPGLCPAVGQKHAVSQQLDPTTEALSAVIPPPLWHRCLRGCSAGAFCSFKHYLKLGRAGRLLPPPLSAACLFAQLVLCSPVQQPAPDRPDSCALSRRRANA